MRPEKWKISQMWIFKKPTQIMEFAAEFSLNWILTTLLPETYQLPNTLVGFLNFISRSLIII